MNFYAWLFGFLAGLLYLLVIAALWKYINK